MWREPLEYCRARTGGAMIKDLIVNLATATDRDPARDYALTIAEAFDAHVVGAAFVYEHSLPGFALGELPAQLRAEVMREQQKMVDAAIERFHAAAKRSLLSAEHAVDNVRPHTAP